MISKLPVKVIRSGDRYVTQAVRNQPERLISISVAGIKATTGKAASLNSRKGTQMNFLKTIACPVALLTLLWATTGCANSFNPTTEEGITQPGSGLTGTVMGGQQPIVGAHIYLLAAGSTGYASAATSLLTHGSGTDSVGTYVTTTFPYGGFDITGDYTCTSGQQVYVLAAGGNPALPGNLTNSYAYLVDVLGACPASGTFAGNIPSISISELTTVAAAYAMAPYATDALHVGSASSTASKLGLANAFASAMQIVNPYNSQVQSTTAAVAGYASASGLSANGTVPTTKIYTIADILAECINSDGTGGACSTLSTNAVNNQGYSSADTFTAAINIAQHPSANVGNLYNMISKTPPFQPTLTSAPNDMTLAVTYSAPNTATPTRAAVDASGNVWFPNRDNNSLTELSSTGVVLSGTTGFTGNSLSTPWAVGINPNGYAFVPNGAGNKVSVFTSSGSAAIAYGALTTQAFYSMAFDGSGTPYLGTSAGIFQISTTLGTVLNTFGTGTMYGVSVNSSAKAFGTSNPSNTLATTTGVLNTLTTYTGGGLNAPTGMSMDASGRIWMANAGTNSVSLFSGSGTAVSASSGYTGGGLNAPWGVAIDGLGNAFVANSNGTLSELNSSGTALSPSTGFTTDSTAAFYSAVVDGSGNVWAPNTDGKIYKFLGLAAPVVTPYAPATAGTRP